MISGFYKTKNEFKYFITNLELGPIGWIVTVSGELLFMTSHLES